MLYNSVKGGLAISYFPQEIGHLKGSTFRTPGAADLRHRACAIGLLSSQLLWPGPDSPSCPDSLLQGPLGRKGQSQHVSPCLRLFCSSSKTFSFFPGSKAVSSREWRFRDPHGSARVPPTPQTQLAFLYLSLFQWLEEMLVPSRAWEPQSFQDMPPGPSVLRETVMYSLVHFSVLLCSQNGAAYCV